MSGVALVSLKRHAIRCYRELLKAQKKVFSGDQQVLQEAGKRTRREFESNRSLTDLTVLQTVYMSAVFSFNDLID
jgi:hypothetical protein